MSLFRLFVLREERHLQALQAFLAGNWKAMADGGKPLAVQVSEEKVKRSNLQNSRHWAVMQQIADLAWVDGRQFNSETWHRHFCREFIGCIELPGGKLEGMTSTALSVAEFSEFDQKIEAYAASELGVQLVSIDSTAIEPRIVSRRGVQPS